MSEAPHLEEQAWMTTEVVRTVAGIDALRAEWDALHVDSSASIFTAWAWLATWMERIGPDRTPCILLARSGDGTLIGLMPLALELRRVGGRTMRRLAFMGESHVGSDYLDIIARKLHEASVTGLFARMLVAMGAEWDVIDLLDLPEKSLTEQVLRKAFSTHDVRVFDRYVCPFEPLIAGESFDAFLRRTGRRDNYLRRRKWLEKQEGFVIERAETPASLPGAMDAFFKLHSARWAADGGSQGIKGEGVQAFHRTATRRLSETAQVRIYTMRVGGVPVASVYGLLHRGSFIYFQSGYDPAWRNKSVGLVLIGETFKDALAAGYTEYDFLRGTETYKADWTTQQRRTVTVRVHAPGARGLWFTWHETVARHARNRVKSVLPTEWVEKVRRLRRRLSAVRG